MDRDAVEFYETDDGNVVAFMGIVGDQGLLAWNGSEWSHHPAGSLRWDSTHQAVYRNHRATPLSIADLRKRLVPPPPLNQYRGKVEPIAWPENFKSSLPLVDVAAPLLAKLRSLPGTRVTIHLILEEDEYESKLGDGRFLYACAAFFDEAPARAWLADLVSQDAAGRKTPQDFGMLYSMKSVELGRDEARNRLVGDLKQETFERYSIEDVVRLLVVLPES